MILPRSFWSEILERPFFSANLSSDSDSTILPRSCPIESAGMILLGGYSSSAIKVWRICLGNSCQRSCPNHSPTIPPRRFWSTESGPAVMVRHFATVILLGDYDRKFCSASLPQRFWSSTYTSVILVRRFFFRESGPANLVQRSWLDDSGPANLIPRIFSGDSSPLNLLRLFSLAILPRKL